MRISDWSSDVCSSDLLQLHALAYNLATFLRCIELPEAMADWSLTSLQLKLIKIGARVVRHARAITFKLAEVAVTGPMVRAVLAAIRRLRTPPSCASPRSMPKLNERVRNVPSISSKRHVRVEAVSTSLNLEH